MIFNLCEFEILTEQACLFVFLLFNPREKMRNLCYCKDYVFALLTFQCRNFCHSNVRIQMPQLKEIFSPWWLYPFSRRVMVISF